MKLTFNYQGDITSSNLYHMSLQRALTYMCNDITCVCVSIVSTTYCEKLRRSFILLIVISSDQGNTQKGANKFNTERKKILGNLAAFRFYLTPGRESSYCSPVPLCPLKCILYLKVVFKTSACLRNI